MDSSLDMSAMIDLKMTDTLKQMGIAREIVNKVQKMRKSAGLNIDDHVEIFYELPSANTLFPELIAQNIASIRSAVKVPFINN